MINLQDPTIRPTPEEIYEYVQNPLLSRLCSVLCETYRTGVQMDFSRCSWMPGWNLKFRKAGKSLCTLYPKEQFFTVLVVVGKKEKEAVEAILPECSARIREIYRETEEGNGQRWLMIDLEDESPEYEDVLRLIGIRRQSR